MKERQKERKQENKKKQTPQMKMLNETLQSNGSDSQACSSCCKLFQQSKATGYAVEISKHRAIVLSSTQAQFGPKTDVKCW